MPKRSPVKAECGLFKLIPSISVPDSETAVRNPSKIRTNLFSVSLLIISSPPDTFSVIQVDSAMQRELFLELLGTYLEEGFDPIRT